MTEPTPRLTRAESRRHTRERLLAAAAEEFKRHGYHGASLEAVAEAAGFTKGAVYSNFATKADLFMALLERYVDAEAAAQHATYDDGAFDAFINDLDRIFERQTADDPGWVVLQVEFWLAAVRDPAIADKLVSGARRLRDQNATMIDQALAAGGVTTPFSGYEMNMLVNAMATGFAIERALDPAAVDPRLLVRATRVLFGLDPEPTVARD